VSLNGEVREVKEGTVVHIPANTVIQGKNAGSSEAILVVVFATTGTPGPLTVSGSPHH
jgi:quercetin dioxygenase-like cupin family protein